MNMTEASMTGSRRSRCSGHSGYRTQDSSLARSLFDGQVLVLCIEP